MKNLPRTPYTARDFNWVNWTPADIAVQAEEGLVALISGYTAVKAVPASLRTFTNTVYGIETAGTDLVATANKLQVLLNASNDVAVRDSAQITIEAIEKRVVDIEQDPGLLQALEEFQALDHVLTASESKLLADYLRDFRRMGLSLPEEQQTLLKNNQKRLAELGSKFDRTINDYEDHISVTRAQLDGLTDLYINGLQTVQQNGQTMYQVSATKYPELHPFIERAKDGNVRRELMERAFQKGGVENMNVLAEIVHLRESNASLLGYASHAAYRTEPRMAKTPETVMAFLTNLVTQLKPLCERDITDVQQAKAADGDVTALHWGDLRFYLERLKEQRYSVESEKVREYFPLEHVSREMFSVYKHLLGVGFTRVTDLPLWHEDVQAWRVDDSDTGLVGYFFLDMHPRPNKYGHAAVFPLMSGRLDPVNGRYMPPVAAMLCNFPKSTPTTPSLLSHDEVETYFHEFGHVMHHMMTMVPYASHAGTNVARDFVEAPSQMLENWVWEPTILARLSKHYQTGQPLPQALLDGMMAAKGHAQGYFWMRQITFALFDLNLHSRPNTTSLPTPHEITALYDETVMATVGVPHPVGHYFPAGFGHLMGYDAGYYGYIWSQVMSADMYTRFATDPLNQQEGLRYRREILAPGSIREEMDSLVAFLGRQPSQDAFLAEVGLVQ